MLPQRLQMSPRTRREPTRAGPKRPRYGPNGSSSQLTGSKRVPDLSVCLQEAEAFALYHKALDLQKHDKFEESSKAYHELLKTPLLKEVIGIVSYCCFIQPHTSKMMNWVTLIGVLDTK